MQYLYTYALQYKNYGTKNIFIIIVSAFLTEFFEFKIINTRQFFSPDKSFTRS